MLTYTYVARDPASGEKISAQIEAESENAAARLLSQKGLVPLEISAKKGQKGSGGFFDRVPTKQKVIFSRQLATLISSGLPLVQSLSSVRGQTSNKTLQVVIGKMINDVEGGISFSEALAAHPKIFNEVFVSLVAAGETSGTLDVSLERLANQQEKDSETVSKLRGAMIYPILVLMVLSGVVLFLLTTVLPKVQDLYQSLPGTKLPLVTRVLLAVSTFIIHFWWVLALILITAVVMSIRWIRTPAGGLVLDNLKLRTPVIGSLFMQVYMARFARTGSILVAAGVPIIKMLTTTSKAIGNQHVEASINKAIEQVKAGKPLSDSLTNDPNFLELVPNMIRTGEQSGSLEGMMSKLADYYEKEVDTKIKNISTTIEPILMVIVGIMALIVVAAVLLPIYSLAGKNLVPHY